MKTGMDYAKYVEARQNKFSVKLQGFRFKIR